MRCMCDEEVRTLHVDDINNPEYRWRFYLLNERLINENDQRLDRCTI